MFELRLQHYWFGMVNINLRISQIRPRIDRIVHTILFPLTLSYTFRQTSGFKEKEKDTDFYRLVVTSKK